jgi:non-heme chloroperoxidase
MPTAIPLQPPPAPLAMAARFGFVRDLPSAARVLCNLSGFGRKAWIDRLLSPRVVSQRIALTTADGETMTVEVSGRGRPLLLVHGLGGSHHDWDAVVAPLSRHHRVYTLDLRGHGTRAHAGARPTLESMARDLALLIDRLSLDRPLLAGHSMGALVVMQYLREYGADQLCGVCFVDQSPRITTDAQWPLGLFGSLTRDQFQATLARLRGDFVGTVVAEAATHLDPLRKSGAPQRLLDRTLRGLLARFHETVGVAPVLAMLESLAECDFRDLVGRLAVPTLVVLGGASHHYGGLPLAEYYRTALTNGTVTIYDASTHSPHQQEPAHFAADLSAFAARRCA